MNTSTNKPKKRRVKINGVILTSESLTSDQLIGVLDLFGDRSEEWGGLEIVMMNVLLNIIHIVNIMSSILIICKKFWTYNKIHFDYHEYHLLERA